MDYNKISGLTSLEKAFGYFSSSAILSASIANAVMGFILAYGVFTNPAALMWSIVGTTAGSLLLSCLTWQCITINEPVQDTRYSMTMTNLIMTIITLSLAIATYNGKLTYTGFGLGWISMMLGLGVVMHLVLSSTACREGTKNC